MLEFTETTTGLARTALVTADTVRLYADMGLLEFRVASNGTRLFPVTAAEAVRRIYATRIANRGRRSVRT